VAAALDEVVVVVDANADVDRFDWDDELVAEDEFDLAELALLARDGL
jgi:hypothetical protein